MKILKSLSLASAAGALALAAMYVEAGAAEQNTQPAAQPQRTQQSTQQNTQQRAATTQQPRRTSRSYSYAPAGNRNVNNTRNFSQTWSRADTKTNFRYYGN